MTQLVVNFLGGEGVGKSTNALLTAGKLKRNGIETEYVPEWIKGQLYAGSTWGFKDQTYTYAKQRKLLMEPLSDPRIRVVVTDSPLILSAIYSDPYDSRLRVKVLEDFQGFNNLNILLTRTIPYSPVGRSGDVEQGKAVDAKILQYLKIHNIPFITAPGEDAEILAFNLAALWVYDRFPTLRGRRRGS
nr:AAA family ATPase [uncultured Anaeromusa sp.]